MKNSCWLIQAFSMFCTIKDYDVRKWRSSFVSALVGWKFVANAASLISDPFIFVSSLWIRKLLKICALQRNPTRTVSYQKERQVSYGMPSASLSCWHRGGYSWATTSSMWCLTSSPQRYWPPGQLFFFFFLNATFKNFGLDFFLLFM